MELIRFFLAQARLPQKKLIFHSTLVGGANILIIAFLNSAAAHAEDKATEIVLLILFAITCIIYLLSQKFIWNATTTEIERLVSKLRMLLVNRVVGSSLSQLERIGKSDIYAAVNQHATTVAMSGLPVVMSIQSGILLFFALLYVAWLSIVAFLVLTLFLGIAIWYAVVKAKESERLLSAAILKESDVYANITDLLEGFKEVKLNQQRETSLVESIGNATDAAKESRTRASITLALNFIGTQTSFYFTIAAMIFVLPFIGTHNVAESVVKITTAAVFLIGPINTIIAVLPNYTNALASLTYLESMKKQLEKVQENLVHDNRCTKALPEFEQIRLKAGCFRYNSDDGEHDFSIGPIDITLNKGEILFVTGGNGSGKTTLIKCLTGLYPLSSGELYFNDKKLKSSQLTHLRNQYSAIFNDYHLFQKFYGLSFDHDYAEELLELFQLTDKTEIGEQQFVTQELSTGQRKRLALIVAILENRPLLILDEWAADQDPTFRGIFYNTLLPRLQKEGRTILAITHDEQYFDKCGRRIHLNQGKVADLTENQ